MRYDPSLNELDIAGGRNACLISCLMLGNRHLFKGSAIPEAVVDKDLVTSCPIPHVTLAILVVSLCAVAQLLESI
jgi:hypothetical protein